MREETQKKRDWTRKNYRFIFYYKIFIIDRELIKMKGLNEEK